MKLANHEVCGGMATGDAALDPSQCLCGGRQFLPDAPVPNWPADHDCKWGAPMACGEWTSPSATAEARGAIPWMQQHCCSNELAESSTAGATTDIVRDAFLIAPAFSLTSPAIHFRASTSACLSP